MPTRGWKGSVLCVKPDMSKDAKTRMFQRQSSSRRVDVMTNGTRNTATTTTSSCSFKLPRRSELSPMKLFKQLGGRLVAVLRMMSKRGSSRRSCGKVTSSEKVTISKLAAASMDSHRAEAIDDCIEFINSSSSLPRSNSVSARIEIVA